MRIYLLIISVVMDDSAREVKVIVCLVGRNTEWIIIGEHHISFSNSRKTTTYNLQRTKNLKRYNNCPFKLNIPAPRFTSRHSPNCQDENLINNNDSTVGERKNNEGRERRKEGDYRTKDARVIKLVLIDIPL